MGINPSHPAAPHPLLQPHISMPRCSAYSLPRWSVSSPLRLFGLAIDVSFLHATGIAFWRPRSRRSLSQKRHQRITTGTRTGRCRWRCTPTMTRKGSTTCIFFHCRVHQGSASDGRGDDKVVKSILLWDYRRRR
jgi:hypothetical protein